MSYSFTIKAASKAEAKEKVAAELAKVAESQPVHAADRQQAQAAADAFIDLLQGDDSKDIQAAINGWVSWSGPEATPTLTGACVGVSISMVPRAAAKAD